MPMNRADYPIDWESLSRRVKDEQGWQCLWCSATHGMLHPLTGSKVVLTTAHIDHNNTNNARENLAALCQRCHLKHDHKQHMTNASKTRREKKRNHELGLEA